jgi:uncharacterized membrane protein
VRRFGVCIRGDNFLVKTGNVVKKNGFSATRRVEAEDSSAAVKMVMDSLKAELENAVLNDKSDPPIVNLEDVSEVYYFQDASVSGPEGIVWDEKVDTVEFTKPVSSLKKRWLALQNRVVEKDIHIHAVCIHFTSALYPVAVLFMLLFLLTGKASFRETYFYMMVLATLSAPFSYFTGVFEWKQRYEGARLPVFVAKIRVSIAVMAAGAVTTLWLIFYPGVLTGGGIPRVVFVLLNVSILPLLVYLGYAGGKVLYERLEVERR